MRSLPVEPTKLFAEVTGPTIPVAPFPHVTAPAQKTLDSQNDETTT
jgi:hypothetical protein